MLEIERTFLAKSLPEGLLDCRHKETLDIYVPKSAEHAVIRLRKQGSSLELTKKTPVQGTDSSRQNEQTIVLTEPEYAEFAKLEGKRLRKIRYYYDHKGRTAEIDVFKDALEGLVLVDFEFENNEEKEGFEMPDFCLAEVTQEKFTAGGMLCGKSYSDIEAELEKYSYKKLKTQ